MAESLEVFDVIHSPWDLIGTIVCIGGKDGKITCEPKDLEQLLRRPAILKIDPMDFLTGWSNGAVACWPKGEAPGAPTTKKPVYGVQDSLTLSRSGSRSANRPR
jgi:hypothetical protein